MRAKDLAQLLLTHPDLEVKDASSLIYVYNPRIDQAHLIIYNKEETQNHDDLYDTGTKVVL